jgi:hypothetical protein
MSLSRWRVLFACTALSLVAQSVQAQQFVPHIGYIYPAGGRQGTSFQVTVGGQFLDGVAEALVSGPGVQVKLIEHVKPITQKEFQKLRDRLQELQTSKKKDAETLKEMAEIRKKIAGFVRRPANPAIAETVMLEVTVAPGAEFGHRDIRLKTPAGLTNPMVFCVGQLPEHSERAAKTSSETPAAKFPRFGKQPAAPAAEKAPAVELPTVINGQVLPGAVDRYRFQAKKGQDLVVIASARQLIPYLSDAVPGWFQATLALYDAKGQELAYDDDFRFNPDPVLHCKIPEDGEYTVEIKDAIYRGREDFVYRITLGELPFITGVFPLGGRAGEKTAVELTGWNLPATKLTHDAKGSEPGIAPLSMQKGEWTTNRVPFAVDTLPECLEREANDKPADGQQVKLPVIVNGRIDRPGDADVFRFEGKAGQRIVAEVLARRLNSPLDSVLRLTDAAGKQLASNDDREDKGSGLLTHHADSWLMATLPADGTYYVHLADVQHQGGPEYGYRLRIGPPREDFELRIVPSSINARAGATIPVSVYALRKDGFAGDIALSLKNPPEGVTLGGAWVPGGQDEVRCTLTVPAGQPEPVSLQLEGRATIDGRELVRTAVPAEDMMQAFAYRHLVPSQELKLLVGGRAASKVAVRVIGEGPTKIPVDGTARVRLATSVRGLAGTVRLELDEPPEGIAIKKIEPSREGLEIVLQSDAKVKPGLKGNLIVAASSDRAPAPKSKGAAKPTRRPPSATLPAIPFEVVAP